MLLPVQLLILAAQEATSTPAPVPEGGIIPVWGWYSIVGVLASTVATLAAAYKLSRDKEVAAKDKQIDSEKEKVTLIQQIGEKQSTLLERAIDAFGVSRTNSEQLADKIDELVDGVKDVREEVRRVGEKIQGR